MLYAGSEADCRLLVSVPEAHRGQGYDFAIRQLYDGEEVGRVTWRFAAA